jgi:F5/8 type C domain.
MLADPVPAEATATASSALRGHEARHAVDGTRNSYWAPAAAGDGRGEFVEFTFAEPVRLVAVLVSPGASGKQPVFRSQARPRSVELSWVTASGDTGSREYELVDAADAQRLDVGATAVRRLRLTVLSSYGARGDRHVAVGEVEFFVRP